MRTGDPGSRAAIGHLLERAPAWAVEVGPVNTVVLSSRVRMARNLAALPFPTRATREQDRLVVARMRRAAGGVPHLRGSEYLDLTSLEAEN